MITVGVLGASGLVGSRLVETFHLGRIAEVIPIVRSTNSLARLARFDLQWRVADAVDFPRLVDAFRGCDVVVHAVHGPNDLIVEAPRIAYRAAQKAGVRRIIYLSTIAVHGQNPDPGTDEASPLHTRHAYAYNNAKVRAEYEFRRFWRKREVELVVLRPGIVFGPRDRWISNIARTIIDRSAYIVSGPGVCNTIYVDNLVHAIRLALTAAVDGETFIIVDRETVTWRDLYLHVSRVLRSDRELPEIKEPVVFQEHVRFLDRLKEFRTARAAVPIIPRAWKLWLRDTMDTANTIKSAVREAQRRRGVNPWQLPAPATPRVSMETYLLYQCRHKFSYARARNLMGYEPPYSVDEGLQRTLAWLKFAGYPVTDRERDETV
jgi:nucleoside-diphosphate-sugar epimerase